MARENGDAKELVSALDNNMQLWVYIKTLASKHDNPLPPETKNNLIKLADYVSSKTLEIGKNVDDINQKTLDSMIMTNLQISEGLIEAVKNNLAQEEAFSLLKCAVDLSNARETTARPT